MLDMLSPPQRAISTPTTTPDAALLAAVRRAVHRSGSHVAAAQEALVCMLARCMGDLAGPQPDFAKIAAQLGVTRQSVYRTLRSLEEKGVVVRQARLEIHLELLP